MRYLVLITLLSGLTAGLIRAGEAAAPTAPAVVSRVHVVSDKVEDVSSIEAWKRSFIKDGMSDKDKALAIWTSAVKFRQQDNPPKEFLQSEETPIDPIKIYNVYGYCMCNGASGIIMSLARQSGLKARGWTIMNHSVPEVFWDDKWHLLDASLMVYFPQANGHIASVEEISKSVEAWYAKNPGFQADEKKLYAFGKDYGWKKGPEVLATAPMYDNNGWLPAATHGWYSNMWEYDHHDKHFPYEYGVALGYQLNVQLRPGEKLTRKWSNEGLHVNALENAGAGSLKGVPGKDDLRYSPQFGDLAPGRIGNGTHEFKPLVGRDLRSALRSENVRVGADFTTNTPVLGLVKETLPGEIVYRLPSSYVYLGGTLQYDNIHAGRVVVVEFSRNHGLDWVEIGRSQTMETFKLDLKPHIYRLYDYQIRFKLAPFASIENIAFTHTIQQSQRALPALAQGENKLTFSAGPQEGTITLEGALDPQRKAKNIVYTEYHPQLENIGGAPLILSGGTGQITFPVTTPGDIKRIRVGLHYRARDKNDGWELQASFDGGKTFKAFGTAEGPFAGNSVALTCNDVPAGTKSALVRFAGKQRNTTCILDWRIDADYAEPHGGFRPVKITYIWNEGADERKNIHVAKTPRETFTITCDTKPVLKSYSVELAD